MITWKSQESGQSCHVVCYSCFPRSAVTIVNVTVIPGNVHSPQFPDEPNNVIINEAATVGTIVTQVKVSDTGRDVVLTRLFVK